MSNKLKSFLILTLILGSVFLFVPSSMAAVDTGVSDVNANIKLTSQSPLKTAATVINILMSLLGMIAISLILWGGFIYMSSGGSEEKISQAKKILRNGAIGLVIILSAWGITTFIISKLLGATGGSGSGLDGCTNNATTSCGCGGAQTCNGGTWGPCLGSTCNPIIDSNTSCDGKAAVAQCQADNDLCGSDYTCDATSCLCKPKAGLGDSCNVNAAGGTCQADNNLCGPYLKCDPDSCVCYGPPVITGISPAGGFCANDQNRGCNQDSDCLGGAKCDTATPNGTANNFITIYGYNFGSPVSAAQNALASVNFEQGAVGTVPANWTGTDQKYSSIGITSGEFKSGGQSIKIHQDANQNWPGICNKATCEDINGCVWKTANNTCNFPNTDASHQVAPVVYNQNENLVWPNSHNVMLAKLVYNLAPLNFKLGDTYSIQFYYKGKTATDISVQIAPSLNSASQCASYGDYAALKPGYSWDGAKITPTPAAGEDPCLSGKTCSDQANTCCLSAPSQKKCYSPLNLTAVSSGTTNEWTLYSYTFQYTPEIDSWLNSSGSKIIEFGLLAGYNPTGAGSDFYVDDFSVNKIVDAGQVTFLGANTAQSQLANSPKILNPNCVSSWTDRQITVAVPSGAATGPLQIKRDGSLTDNLDTTNNTIGPKIADFVRNTIYRPSLCQISPTQGALGSKVEYQGINLKNGIAYFGEYSSAYQGINSTFTADNLSGQTLAPSIIPGQTTTFVERTLSGINQKSNALFFVKEKDPGAGPYISSFYPESGPAGQYVTILGSGFGNVRGSRQVFFGDVEASYNFPEVCANSVWSDSQVIVKVPNGLSSNEYQIKMNLGDTNINTDLLSPNNTFHFSPVQSLSTNICKIDPTRGQIGDKVSLWGENFGNSGTDASIVFNRNVSTSSKITKDGLADKVQTFVPVSNNTPAITGPVKIMKNGEWGNEVNFTVGKCTSNDECNSASPVCCPNNTFKTGSCAASLLSCYFDVPNSVYETKFNTTLSATDSNTKFDSCIAMASFYNGCQTGQFCPNSPGKCSPFNPIAPEVLSDCGSSTSACGALDYCKTNPSACTYNATKDICQAKSCVLEKELSYTLGTQTFKGNISCRAYTIKATGKTVFAKQLKVNTTCPDGYINVGGGYCVNATPILCDPCATGFKCNEDSNKTDDLGICESNQVCGNGATCTANAGKFSCLKTQQPKCDCCCSIDKNTPTGNPDCCAPLKCGGTCGSDSTNDGAGQGTCSGCTAMGTTQAARDAACNCSTTSGKFCDISKPGGACVDCAALDQAGCSVHSNQCCFDQAKGVCQGGNGTLLTGGRCAYYDCDANNKTTCNQSPAPTGQFLATSACVTGCAKNPKTICDLIGSDATKCSAQDNCCFDAKNKTCNNIPVGSSNEYKLNISGFNYCAYYNCNGNTQKCNNTASTTGDIIGFTNCSDNCKANTTSPGTTCASATPGSCNTDFCGSPFKCLSNSGGPTTSDCGICCCTPGTKNGDLTCLANKGTCTGGSRGLFCGCSSDTQCGGTLQGCGNDTCCHGRPSVVSTAPKNNDTNVCRNVQIEINFSQEMSIPTLTDNILLLEEKAYGGDTCPAGTTLSFNNFKPKSTNFLARLLEKITSGINRLFSGSTGNSALAVAPSPDKLYCVSPITVDSQLSYANGATSTKVYIQPQKILSAKANYFVVIKGDEGLNSNTGVMSIDKIGLNGVYTSPISSSFFSSNDYIKVGKAAFNGIGFKNSYTFSFTTQADSGSSKGLCSINSVVVKPSSFLIKTADNDSTDDNPSDANFNTKSDSDRAVYSYAYSSDNQLLQPIPGYSWHWNWKIADESIAQKLSIAGLKENQIVVNANKGVTDKSTKVTATINMDGLANASLVGNKLSGVSDLYVFICANPWPMESSGVWNPWSDQEATDSKGNKIINYNYKFYYCRDAGKPGTEDDLPAVIDPALILGSSGNMFCSNNGATCNTDNDCGAGNTCIWNVLKESYFFREAIPQAGEITSITSTGAGGQVSLNWYSPITSSVTTESFKIYYGLVGGTASSYVTSLSLTEANCTNNSGKNYCNYKINKLTDGSKYYFKVSAISTKKTESPLSGSKEVTPTDTTAPKAPTGLSSTLSNGQLKISWTANTDDALYYRLFHGLFSGKKAADSVDSPNQATSLIFSQSTYRSGDNFFFLAAIDKSGNVSATSNEIKVVIPTN